MTSIRRVYFFDERFLLISCYHTRQCRIITQIKKKQQTKQENSLKRKQRENSREQVNNQKVRKNDKYGRTQKWQDILLYDEMQK